MAKWGAWLAVAALLALVCVAVMVAVLQQPVDGLENAVEAARRWRKIGVALQTVAAGIVLWRWPAISSWCGRRGIVRSNDVHVLQAARVKVAMVLAVYLVFAGIGPAELLRQLEQIF
ncbi:MAG: hypothetical protein DI587_14635 [Variovorax paradoxus]|nr:MAG: hypothetical protein DI583_14635 [Variovorax paradoxus]PZQ09647.1 MAG: hypothetical protein DI587_14635 [Variovorax paradoxus]